MRTTLTLDDDVAMQLKQKASQSGRSFKETVNDILRLGLLANTPASDTVVPTPRPMGRPLIDLTQALSLVAQFDDAKFGEPHSAR